MRCQVCGRVLTDPVSIELEMGPVCRSMNGTGKQMDLFESQTVMKYLKIGKTDPRDQSFSHEFKGFGMFPSKCWVDVRHLANGKTFVLFQDQNQGTSVTNAAEQLATEIRRKLDLPKDTQFAEFYPQYHEGISAETGGYITSIFHSIDWLHFDYDAVKDEFSNPDWIPGKMAVTPELEKLFVELL